VITASTVKITTMADDTLRITLDIEPRYAQEAFALFGGRGTPCVLARITAEAAQEHAQSQSQDKPKGGPLARLAGQWCNLPEFQEWCECSTPDSAAIWIRDTCDVQSRADLDHNGAAAEAFNREIREPFMKWCDDNHITLL
jgi:hypothetical protein